MIEDDYELSQILTQY